MNFSAMRDQRKGLPLEERPNKSERLITSLGYVFLVLTSALGMAQLIDFVINSIN